MRMFLVTAVMAACGFSATLEAQTATDLNCTSCVSEAEIANQAITTAKILDGTIKAADIQNGSVTSDKIANGTVAKKDLTTQVQDQIDGALKNLTVQRVSASGQSVIGANCPSGRIPVAASCECDNANGSRNLGVLFGCTVSGTGAAAGCFEEARSFNAALPPPLAIVRAVCLGGTTGDGTPWVPAVTGLVADSGTVTAEQAAAQALWMKEQHASFEALLARFRAQREAYDRTAK